MYTSLRIRETRHSRSHDRLPPCKVWEGRRTQPYHRKQRDCFQIQTHGPQVTIQQPYHCIKARPLNQYLSNFNEFIMTQLRLGESRIYNMESINKVLSGKLLGSDAAKK